VYSKFAATDASAPPTYMVTTTSLPRKYTFLGDLPLTSLSYSWRIIQALFKPWPLHAADITGGASTSTDAVELATAEERFADRALVASSWQRYRTARKAFASHGSQYSWDRNLYLIFSRYVWFNDMVRVKYGSEQGQ
jgi:N-acetylglucosaminylphosphatidylinositol deacetylase